MNVPCGPAGAGIVNEPGAGFPATPFTLAVDPIGTAIAVVVTVGLLLARRRSLAAGLLIALGICGTLLWVRYVGIPIAQWTTNEDVASPKAGGFVGLAGGVLVFCAGWRLAVVRNVGVPAARPLPTS